MNFTDGLFDVRWNVGAFVPLAMVWWWCLRTATWRRLAEPKQLNVWLGTIVLLALMWRLNAGIRPGLNLHLLGATLFTLMFGRQLAIIGLSAVLAAVTFNGASNGVIGWLPYALNAMFMVVLPVIIAWAILRVVERRLPAHFFVYVFVAAFFGAALNTILTGLAAMLLLACAGAYTAGFLFGDFFLSYVLLAFAEAWLTGIVITLMIVYYPHWVGTFDDRRYLWNK